MQERTRIVPNAEVIVRARILAGLNKLDMAKAADIPHSSVIRAERGKGVSPRTATGISRVLGIPFDELFTIQAPGATSGAGQAPASGSGGEV